MSNVETQVEKLFIRLTGEESVSWREVNSHFLSVCFLYLMPQKHGKIVYHDDALTLHHGKSQFLNKWFHGWSNSSKSTSLPISPFPSLT